MGAIRVLIVDDQPVIRDGLKFIIQQDREIQVVECAGNGNEALEACDRCQPDVVLMDIVMPVCDGVEGTRQIKDRYKNIKVIILTTFSDNEKVTQALKNGADGYVLKDIESDELILTIKSIAKGLRVMHENPYGFLMKRLEDNDEQSREPDVKGAGLKYFGYADREDRTKAEEASGHFASLADYNLTEREIEIIRLIVFGKSNKEIAGILFLSQGSVRNMISSILMKTKLKDRTQLAVFAVKNGI